MARMTEKPVARLESIVDGNEGLAAGSSVGDCWVHETTRRSIRALWQALVTSRVGAPEPAVKPAMPAGPSLATGTAAAAGSTQGGDKGQRKAMPFADRIDAGRKLAAALAAYRGKNAIILALPRGGVPVAKEVAAALGAPLDLVLVRKIGVPGQPELAMGAVVDGAAPLTVRNRDVIAIARVTPAAFNAVRDRELAEIRRRRVEYLGARPHPQLAGRTVIVVDDGVATGATTRAALRAVKGQKPGRLILAVPVAPKRSLAELAGEADEIICLEAHQVFGAIGLFYADFGQVSDREVKDILAEFPADGIAAT